MLKKIALITIGQSPRTDVVSEIKPILSDVEIIECGALDNLTEEDTKALAPRENSYLLVTRLRSGVEVRLDREKVVPLIQSCIDRVERDVDIVGLLCTGEFPELKSNKLLIESSEILLKVVEALKIRKLGVIVPNPKQIEITRAKWLKVVKEVKVFSVSPYSEGIDELRKASEYLKDCDLIVLDCIGYSINAKRIVSDITKKPVLIPRTLMAHIIKDIIEV